jgi:hypothetical protein
MADLKLPLGVCELYCDASFSWYEVSCQHCAAPLASYGPDPGMAAWTQLGT